MEASDMTDDSWDLGAVYRRLEARGDAGGVNVCVEDVLLAYARWKGRTDEPAIEPEKAKDNLDKLLDAIEPDAWNGVKELIGEEVSESLVVGTMRYAQQRGLEQTKAIHWEVEQMEPWSVSRDQDAPSPTRPRRRGR